MIISVVASALTALSFGGGALLLLGGFASAGLSFNAVFEALEDYKQKNAANDVGLLSEDPSLAWVMLAITGAVAAIKAPVVAVHISNIFSREDYRHVSYVGARCKGSISGFGLKGYELAIQSLLE